jgi:hypothetical protein
MDGIQALGADGQDRNVGEGGVTKTAVGGEKRGKEALGDGTKKPNSGSLSVASTACAG